MNRRKALGNTREIYRLMRIAAAGIILGVFLFHRYMVLGERVAWTVAAVMCWLSAFILKSWCNAVEELLKSNKLKFYF